MCDMSQFVVVVPIPDETSVTFAIHCMQHVLIKFLLCHFVVLDDRTHFKGVFIAICKALNSNYNILAKRNHKGLTVESFNRFINMSVTIATEDRGTNNFFPVDIEADYT